MGRELLMAIDVGTQSTRVAILDATGRIFASVSRPQEMSTPRPGWAEQDPDVWWRNVVTGIRGALQQAEATSDEVIAVGVCGQMHATVPLGEDGELLAHGVQLWCDKRGSEEADSLRKRASVEQAMRLAGNPPVPAWLGIKIKWLKAHQPDLYGRTWKFLPSKDFINYRLTGEPATDFSEASGSFLMDASTNSWSTDLASFLDLEVEKLPELCSASDVMGEVSSEAASVTGLAEGTPVVAGAGDMLCMLVSAGLTRPGRAADVTGTASIMAVHLDEPVVDRRLMNLHHAIPGWIPFGIIDSGGGALKWFKDNLCQREIAVAAERGQDVYDILNPKAAAIAPGSEGLLFFPYLMGERSLGTPMARGVVFGLTPRTGIGAMTRAIMEGVTYELRRTLEIIEDAGHVVDKVYTVGGGARSDVWSQIKADVYKKPVYTFESPEGGIMGSAVLAGVGAGIFPDPPTGIEQVTRVDKAFEPDPGASARYDYLYALFKEIHDRLQEPFERLARMP